MAANALVRSGINTRLLECRSPARNGNKSGTTMIEVNSDGQLNAFRSDFFRPLFSHMLNPTP